MHDVLTVRVRQGPRDIAENRDRLPQGQLARAFDARAERFTVDEGHRVVRQAIRFPRRKQRDDVGMLQPRGERDLAAESLEDQTADEIRCENLGEDKSAER